MAHYRKRSSTWTAQVKLSGGKTRSKSFPTKPMAAAWARDIESQRDKGVLRDPKLDKITVRSLWPTFLKVRRGLLAPATVKKNSSHWTNHIEPHIGDWAVASVRRSHIEAWVVSRVDAGVGLPTIEACVRLLSALMECAVDDDLIVANPARKVRMPKHLPKRKRFVTADEIERVLDVVEGSDHRLLLALLATTGLRIGEALGLTKADVGVGAASVSVRQVWTRDGVKEHPKTHHAVRTVPVPEELRDLLKEHTRAMLPATRLFYADDRNLNRRVLAPACQAAKVEVFTLHHLRHHAASVWVAGGVPLFEVARALGQADTRMVERTYGHLVPGAHDRLLAASTRVSLTP